jgi:hypothetical protein
MRVNWSVDLPLELRDAITTYVDRYLDFLPNWCHTLEIQLETDPKADVDVSMAADYQYRSTKMCLKPDFLTRTLEDRELTVVHEFAHVLGAPLVTYVDAVVAMTEKKDPDTADMLKALQEAGEEAATEDIATLLWRLTEDRRV